MSKMELYKNEKELQIGLDENGEGVYLKKHEWACDWYWSMGHLEVGDSMFSMNSVIPNRSGEGYLVFELIPGETYEVELVDGLDGYVLMELFEQAFNLEKVYEMYYRGTANIKGYMDDMGVYSIRDADENKDIAREIEADLSKVLDDVWEYVIENRK